LAAAAEEEEGTPGSDTAAEAETPGENLEGVLSEMGLTEEEASGAAAKIQAIQRGKLARRQLAADVAEAATDGATTGDEDATTGEPAEASAAEAAVAVAEAAVEAAEAAAAADAADDAELADFLAELGLDDEEMARAAAKIQAIHRGKLARREAAIRRASLRPKWPRGLPGPEEITRVLGRQMVKNSMTTQMLTKQPTHVEYLVGWVDQEQDWIDERVLRAYVLPESLVAAFDEQEAATEHITQVRRTPSWPRSWANFSLFIAVFPQEYMGQLASFGPI
jgi:hypothetical protein